MHRFSSWCITQKPPKQQVSTRSIAASTCLWKGGAPIHWHTTKPQLVPNNEKCNSPTRAPGGALLFFIVFIIHPPSPIGTRLFCLSLTHSLSLAHSLSLSFSLCLFRSILWAEALGVVCGWCVFVHCCYDKVSEVCLANVSRRRVLPFDLARDLRFCVAPLLCFDVVHFGVRHACGERMGGCCRGCWWMSIEVVYWKSIWFTRAATRHTTQTVATEKPHLSVHLSSVGRHDHDDAPGDTGAILRICKSILDVNLSWLAGAKCKTASWDKSANNLLYAHFQD